MGQERRLPRTWKILQGRAYRSVQTGRAKLAHIIHGDLAANRHR